MKSVVLCLLLVCLASSLSLSRGLAHELNAETSLHASLEATSTAELNALTSSLTTPYVLVFTASWCRPCTTTWAAVKNRENLAGGKWVAIKLNIDLQALGETVANLGVVGIPALAFYRGGTKVFQRAGGIDSVGFATLEKKYLL